MNATLSCSDNANQIPQHPLLEPHELEDVHPAILASKLLHGELPSWIVPGDDSSFADILRQV